MTGLDGQIVMKPEKVQFSEWRAMEGSDSDHVAVNKAEASEDRTLSCDEETFLRLLPDELVMTSECRHDNKDQIPQTPESGTRTALTSQIPSVLHVTEQQHILPQIMNVLSTVKLGCNLDLNRIAQKAWNVEYKSETRNLLIMRIHKPQTTAVIYESGTIVCTGAKSEEQSRAAARRFARILQRLGFPVSFLNFRVGNMMATCNTFPLSMERLFQLDQEHCSYEPELFPGLFYSGIPGISITVFASGRIVFKGAKKSSEIYRAFYGICPILSCCRRQ